MQVLKFGGSSVANSSAMNKVIDITKKALLRDKTILVSSAIKGCTNELIHIGETASNHDKSYEEKIDKLEERHLEIINELLPHAESEDVKEICASIFKTLRDTARGVYLVRELSAHSKNVIVSVGELLSTRILSAKFTSLGIRHKWVDSREVVRTELIRSINQVDSELTYSLCKAQVAVDNVKLFIFPGFIASDKEGRATTLGRGGSDYTASILAAGCDARTVEIWTDVSGMHTADPRVVAKSRTIENLSYKEALELSHFGAKVIYAPTIQPLVHRGIPIYIKNTFRPEDAGTLIEAYPPEGDNKIKGISSSDNIALISMVGSGMIGIPGYSSRLFAALSDSNINIILITQASSVHTMSIAIDEGDAAVAKEAIDATFAYEISLNKVEPLKVEKGFSIISLVGDDLKNQSGISGKMFDSLASRGVNIRAIAQGSSEKNVSAVVNTGDIRTAVNTIHTEFFADTDDEIKIFVVGNGVVARSLLCILEENTSKILSVTGKRIVLCGIANSTKHLINVQGLDVKTASEQLLAEGTTEGDYIDKIVHFNMANTIFVDCSSGKDVALRYRELLDARINVVTSNKVAGAANYSYYSSLKESCRMKGSAWCYETTVGAALPIISTIKQMINAGDEIHKIEAIVSGTLNYLFSTYDTTQSFAAIVRYAKEQGYTETDPRIDLSGIDVLRKTTILAREIGQQIEIDDIKSTALLGAEYYKGDLDTFYTRLEANEQHFINLYNKAKEAGNKLRFVVSIEGGSAEIGLKEIDASHPFYNVNGSDNSLIVKSKYYPQSVRVAGSGAGGHQTALGILNEIIVTSK